MTVRIGFGLITTQVPPGRHSVTEEYADAIASARLVEECGFDGVWVSEHHLAEDSYLPSCLPMLSAIAAVTTRIELGTGIALAPMHDPIRFAEDCAVTDQISGGRLVVGLGAGWRRQEFNVFGVPLAERGRRTERLVDICRRAWGPVTEGDPISYVTPKPARSIPILLGGTAPAPIGRAGRLADGYIGTPQNSLPAFRSAIETFDRAAVDAGRDPAKLRIVLHVNAWVSLDGTIPPAVEAAMWHQIGAYARWHALDDGSTDTAFPPLDRGRLNARTMAGTPDEVTVQAMSWVTEFGERDFEMIFRLHYPGMRLVDAEPAIRMFATSVAPKLRKAARSVVQV